MKKLCLITFFVLLTGCNTAAVKEVQKKTYDNVDLSKTTYKSVSAANKSDNPNSDYILFKLEDELIEHIRAKKRYRNSDEACFVTIELIEHNMRNTSSKQLFGTLSGKDIIRTRVSVNRNGKTISSKLFSQSGTYPNSNTQATYGIMSTEHAKEVTAYLLGKSK